MSARLRVGLIGCGAIARTHHLPNLLALEDVDLAAVADPDTAARTDAAARAKAAAYSDAAELLAHDGLGAVVICTPNPSHAEVAEAAARAGLHIFVEKPLATTAEAGRAVVSAATAGGVVGMVGFNRRFHPAFVAAHRLVREGAVGELQWAQSVFSEPTALAAMPGWKQQRATGGGALLDLGSHHFDLLRWFFAAEPEVAAAGQRSAESDQDSAWAHLRFSSGASAQSLFSFRGSFADAIELGGDAGTLRVDRHRGTLVLRTPRRTGYGLRRRRVLSRPLARWSVERLIPGRGEPSYRRALEAFVARIRGEEVETPTLGDGLRSLELVLAAERACASS